MQVKLTEKYKNIDQINFNTLSAIPTKWSNTLLNNSSGVANELLESVWPFCGVGAWRVKKTTSLQTLTLIRSNLKYFVSFQNLPGLTKFLIFSCCSDSLKRTKPDICPFNPQGIPQTWFCLPAATENRGSSGSVTPFVESTGGGFVWKTNEWFDLMPYPICAWHNSYGKINRRK